MKFIHNLIIIKKLYIKMDFNHSDPESISS